MRAITHLVIPAILCSLLMVSCSPPPAQQTSENRATQSSSATATALTTKTIVLSIDGGGVKGIIPATILAKLEEDLQRPVYTVFDVVGGTSTGGIITMGLTTSTKAGKKPMTATDIKNIYLKNCGQILVKNHQPTGPEYYANSEGEGIEAYLQKLMGNTTLMDAAHNIRVLPNTRTQQAFTTTYIVNGQGGGKQDSARLQVNYGPYLFNWYDAKRNLNSNYYVWEAARGTSAAPTYFPIAHVGGGQGVRSQAAEKWVIDGGITANNPVMFALEEGLKLNNNLNDLIIVSLGCGLNPFNAGVGVTNAGANSEPYGQTYGFWGTPSWLASDLYNLAGVPTGRGRIIELLMDANQLAVEQYIDQLAALSGMYYIRLQPTLSEDLTDSFDCTEVSKLEQKTLQYISRGGAGYNNYMGLVRLLRSNLTAVE